jgi:hypothetical protein
VGQDSGHILLGDWSNWGSFPGFGPALSEPFDPGQARVNVEVVRHGCGDSPEVERLKICKRWITEQIIGQRGDTIRAAEVAALSQLGRGRTLG